MDKIKTGLAAFGMSGQIFHAPFISTNPAFELTAVTERSKELSKERYPEARIVRSFEELIALDELELIVVNTPDSTHYEYARQALEAGKNVIVEKPFTTTVEQGQELVDLARSKGLAISVYQNRRWDSDFLTVQEVLDKGLLGRLVEFESTFPRYRNFIKPGTWKETGSLGGGLTYNLGAHVIDQAVQLFGVPEAVFADIDIIRTGGMVDDYFVIHLFRPSKAPHVKVTLKSSYLCANLNPASSCTARKVRLSNTAWTVRKPTLMMDKCPAHRAGEWKTKVSGDSFTRKRPATSSAANTPASPETMPGFTTTSTATSASANRS